jgi:hypothetical protein
MLEQPPEELTLQTHSHLVANAADTLAELSRRCDVRVHVSIETDRDHIPGLPPHGSPIGKRFAACEALKSRGIRTVVTVAPLLPIADPPAFFRRISEAADAVVLDHFIGGDGSGDGRRTLATPLPAAMATIEPRSTSLGYLDEMAAVARLYLPGRVGIGSDGFAGRYL